MQIQPFVGGINYSTGAVVKFQQGDFVFDDAHSREYSFQKIICNADWIAKKPHKATAFWDFLHLIVFKKGYHTFYMLGAGE